MSGFEAWVRSKRDRAEARIAHYDESEGPSVEYWMGQRAAFNWVLFELGARGLRDGDVQ